MRITYRTSGGLAPMPGLQRPVEIDLAQLGEAEQARLRGLVSAAQFFDAPEPPAARPATAPRGADLQTITLTIEDGERRRTLQIQSSPAEGPLQELLATLRAEVRARRAAELASREPPAAGSA